MGGPPGDCVSWEPGEEMAKEEEPSTVRMKRDLTTGFNNLEITGALLSSGPCEQLFGWIQERMGMVRKM